MNSSNEGINLAGWLIIIGILIIFVPLIEAAGKFIKKQLILLGLSTKQATFITITLFMALAYLILMKTNIAEMLRLLTAGGV